MPAMLEVEDLTRTFGERVAVDGLTFQVRPGEVFGVLGHNGAGKTTTVRLLNGLLSPTRGRMQVAGFDPVTAPAEVRRRTGVLTEAPALYEGLSARDNLRFFAEMFELPPRLIPARIQEVLTAMGLAERAQEQAGTWSKGMKQRLALARALLHDPPVLFLDEPTAGLDPEATQRVGTLIAHLSRQEGRTVYLCTHHLAEAQRLCDRVALFGHGRLLALGTVAELGARLWGGGWLELALAAPLAGDQAAALRDDPRLLAVEGEACDWRLQLREQEATPQLIADLAAGGARIMRVQPAEVSLEAVYFALQAQEATA